MKKTISTIAAVAMLSTSIAPAFAGIVTNGGQPLLSITDIQTKIDSGEFYNYPGVIRVTEGGLRIGPTKGSGYIFADKFKPGMALPQVNDIAKLLKAIDKKDEVTLVASNEFILPCNPVFKELGRQNGVSCGEFMEHIVVGTSDTTNEQFEDYATATTKAALEVLNVTSVDTLVKAGVDQSLALKVALEQVQEKIGEITDLTATLDLINDTVYATEQAAFNAGFAEGVASVSVNIPEGGVTIATTGSSWRTSVDVVLSNGVTRTISFDAYNVRQDAQAYTQSVIDGTYAFYDASTNTVQVVVDDSETELRRFSVEVPAIDTSVVDTESASFRAGYNAARLQNQAVVEEVRASHERNLTGANGVKYDSAQDAFEAGELAGETDLAASINQTIDHNIHRYSHDTLDGTHFRDHEIITNAVENGSWYNPGQNRGSALADAMADVVRAGNPELNGVQQILARNALIADITENVRDLVDAAYDNGYADGYADGYRDGFVDGANSVRQ